MRRSSLLPVLLLGLACTGPGPVVGAGGRIPFSAETWELSGDAAIETAADGETVLTAATGRAEYRDVELENGTIEFDLEVTEHRSFVFVTFRNQAGGEHEEIYFRPHKSRLPDAIQYTPTYKNQSQWQLYHDAYSTAAAPLPPGKPIHVKLVVQSQMGMVYVDDMETPRLLFYLARPAAPGFVSLSSFMPTGGPEGITTARFTNLSVRPDDVDETVFPVVEAFMPPAGRVSEWLLSPTFAPPEGPVRELPRELLESSDWQRVGTTLIGGFVEIERHVERPDGARRAAVLARLQITVSEATTRRLDLGFSDEVSVFLNGRLIASANDDYSFNEPRRQGLLDLSQLAVYLPLEEGENELTLAVTDRFGGWGLAGQFEDPSGLGIEPR